MHHARRFKTWLMDSRVSCWQPGLPSTVQLYWRCHLQPYWMSRCKPWSWGGVNRIIYWSPGVASLPHKCQSPLPSTRQHPSYGDCLEVKREYYQNCSVLGCVTQCSQSAAHSCEQFLQVQQIGFVTLRPLRHA